VYRRGAIYVAEPACHYTVFEAATHGRAAAVKLRYI